MVKWKLTGRIEVFRNLQKLYSTYSDSILGLSIHTLYRKNIKEGYANDRIAVIKKPVN